MWDIPSVPQCGSTLMWKDTCYHFSMRPKNWSTHCWPAGLSQPTWWQVCRINLSGIPIIATLNKLSNCHNLFPELSPTQPSVPCHTGFTPVLPLCIPQASPIGPNYSQFFPMSLPCHIPGHGQNLSWNWSSMSPCHRG